MGGQQSVDKRLLLDRERRRGAEAFGAQHLLEVRSDLGGGTRRHAIEHQTDADPTGHRAAEELPRHRVGVAHGSRDEQPQIRRVQQLGGHGSVGVDDGVDVGRVEQGQRLGHSVAGDQLDVVAGLGSAAADPGQAGEDPVVSEPALSVGVVHQHRAAGRRAQHTRSRDFGAHQAVHQRRLPRSRRAADDGQHGSVHVAQAGQDIVLELPHSRGGLCPRLIGPGKLD